MPSPSEVPTDSRLVSTEVGLAVERLRSGGLVAIPTETVYGLAADAERAEAVARVFEVKARPTGHPLIVHVAGPDALDGWVVGLSDAARTLAETCWPGPLTMVLERGPRASHHVTGGRDTVGIRVPGHPVTLELLHRFGGGLAAPSANRFGRVSPTTARHVVHDLGTHLVAGRDLVLDGGPSEIGVESTIVDLTCDPPQVLRAGAISVDDIDRLLDLTTAAASGPSRASGMLTSHYAPSCRVVVVDRRDDAERLASQAVAAGQRVDVLDRSADPVAAARLLYADLRRADESALDVLVVVQPPAQGLGIAVRDRLSKAAAGSATNDPDRPSPIG
ncbi:MAG: L-threonylcarbamoyladenylate synthase [Ilumatobacteraceae bacterium]